MARTILRTHGIKSGEGTTETVEGGALDPALTMERVGGSEVARNGKQDTVEDTAVREIPITVEKVGTTEASGFETPHRQRLCKFLSFSRCRGCTAISDEQSNVLFRSCVVVDDESLCLQIVAMSASTTLLLVLVCKMAYIVVFPVSFSRFSEV